MPGKGEVRLTKVTLGFVHECYTCVLNTYCVPGSMQVAGGLEMNQSDLQMPESPPTQNLRNQTQWLGLDGRQRDGIPHYHARREPPALPPRDYFLFSPSSGPRWSVSQDETTHCNSICDQASDHTSQGLPPAQGPMVDSRGNVTWQKGHGLYSQIVLSSRLI